MKKLEKLKNESKKIDEQIELLKNKREEIKNKIKIEELKIFENYMEKNNLNYQEVIEKLSGDNI